MSTTNKRPPRSRRSVAVKMRRAPCTQCGMRGSRDGTLCAYCRKLNSRRKPTQTAEQRFMSHVSIEGSCWIWTGHINASGYGACNIGKFTLAHRWAYAHFTGVDITGLELHHNPEICGKRSCVNPAHVSPVLPGEHPDKPTVLNQAKTHCPKGHPYSGANLYVDGIGSRHCRECRRVAGNTYYWQHHEQERKKQAIYAKAHPRKKKSAALMLKKPFAT